MGLHSPPMEGSECKVTELLNTHASLRVAFFEYKRRLWLYLCESDILSSVFGSPFVYLFYFIYDAFDSVKIIQ